MPPFRLTMPETGYTLANVQVVVLSANSKPFFIQANDLMILSSPAGKMVKDSTETAMSEPIVVGNTACKKRSEYTDILIRNILLIVLPLSLFHSKAYHLQFLSQQIAATREERT